MSEGNLTATFVIVFRETLEAGLIVGIILTVLARLQAMRYAAYVWMSVAAAVVASLLAGWGISLATQGVQGQWEKIIEGSISLIACCVLTYMVFWMDKQARSIRPHVETQVESAVSNQQLAAIVILPFLAVFREGAETVLFLKAVAIQSSASVSLWGGLLGAAGAVAITMIIFVGGRRVQLKPLFQSTGVLLLLIAAGLLAYGIHELQELGWIPVIRYPVWNINHILNEKEGIGSFLKALFGYNGNPSLLEVIAYVSYIITVVWVLRCYGRSTPEASNRKSVKPGAGPKKEAPVSTLTG